MTVYRRKLKKRATELFNEIDNKIKCINLGGCLFASYGVYKALQKEGFSMRGISIMQLDRFSQKWKENNQKFLQGKTEQAVSGNHFVLYIGGMIFDSNEYSEGFPLEEDDYYRYRLKIKEKEVDRFFESCIRDKDWREDFNRKKELPKLSKITGFNFKKYVI